MLTTRQRILKILYPFSILLSRLTGKRSNIGFSSTPAKVNFFDFIASNPGEMVIPPSTRKGKKILLVNTASDCIYTNQYEGMETLYHKFKEKLEILAFPSNEFGNQEKGNEEVIHSFCKINYGVSFPLMPESQVKKGLKQNRIFQWLTDKEKNGWN